MKLAILASHEGTTLQAILDACAAGTLAGRVVAVISNTRESGALEKARAAGIPAHHRSSRTHPDPTALDAAICQVLVDATADLVVLAGYMKRVGPRTLARFRNRVLSTHPALLPKFGGQGMYGLHVHRAVLAAGEAVTGASIHLVTEEYDAGPVIAQCEVSIQGGDTPEVLAQRVQERERALLVDTLGSIARGHVCLPSGGGTDRHDVPTEPEWLRWARELQAIAQIGLTYSTESHFDVERYARVREIAAEIMAAGARVEKSAVLDLMCGETGYATPKVDVRGVVFRDDRILLVREVADGAWTLPGGWADVNESPSASVVREVREESGYETRPVKLLAVYDRSKHGHIPAFPFHVYKLFILCEITGGEASTSRETSAAGFFAEHDLPELSLSRITPAQVRRLFEHHHHPEWATDFD